MDGFEGGYMKFTKLDEEQRKFFDQNGYLMVHNALDADMVERVTAACDEVVERRYKDPGRGRASLINVIPEDDVFLSLLAWEKTVPLVVQLLSFNLRTRQVSHYLYSPDPPEAEPSTHWHRDFMHSPFDLGPHRYPRLLIKIVYQLSDTTVPLSGNTVISPRSNNLTERLEIPEGAERPGRGHRTPASQPGMPTSSRVGPSTELGSIERLSPENA